MRFDPQKLSRYYLLQRVLVVQAFASEPWTRVDMLNVDEVMIHRQIDPTRVQTLFCASPMSEEPAKATEIIYDLLVRVSLVNFLVLQTHRTIPVRISFVSWAITLCAMSICGLWDDNNRAGIDNTPEENKRPHREAPMVGRNSSLIRVQTFMKRWVRTISQPCVG